jgi:hypothetical protein
MAFVIGVILLGLFALTLRWGFKRFHVIERINQSLITLRVFVFKVFRICLLLFIGIFAISGTYFWSLSDREREQTWIEIYSQVRIKVQPYIFWREHNEAGKLRDIPTMKGESTPSADAVYPTTKTNVTAQTPEIDNQSSDVKSQKQSKRSVAMTPFQELVKSLVSDSLILLPKAIIDKLSDATKIGMIIPEQNYDIYTNIFESQNPQEVAFVAGLIVQRIYGSSVAKEFTIPQTVFYSYSDGAIESELSIVKTKLSKSLKFDRDAYNASLNLLVNILFKLYSGSESLNNKPADGIYLRNANDELYLYLDA